MTLVASATNTSIVALTYCNLGGLKAFQAPWGKHTLELLAFAAC